jgi:hypothetical protein
MMHVEEASITDESANGIRPVSKREEADPNRFAEPRIYASDDFTDLKPRSPHRPNVDVHIPRVFWKLRRVRLAE